MRVRWAMWVESVHASDDGRRVTIANAYEEVWFTMQDFPVVLHPLVAMQLEAGIGEYGTTKEVTVKLLTVDATIIAETGFDVEISEYADSPRSSWLYTCQLSNVFIYDPDTYYLSILIDNREEWQLPLCVIAPQRFEVDF